MPQGKNRDEKQKEAFGRMLSNINLLFLGASVFILCDMSCTCSRMDLNYQSCLLRHNLARTCL